MSPCLIILSGSINAGKTTVAKALQRLVTGLAHVEVDTLGDFIQWMPLEQQIPINLRNALLVSRTFLEAAIPVVLSYPLSTTEYAELVNGIHPFPVHAFTLAPPMATARSNRGTRALTPWEMERIKYHYATGIASPSFGVTLDNGNESPDTTANRILTAIHQQTSQPI